MSEVPTPGDAASGVAAAASAPDGSVPDRSAPDGSAAASDDRTARMAMLGTLSAGIAHEFNNLLTVLQGSLENLREQPLDPQGRRQLDHAGWGADQAARLVRQVLEFARPGNGRPRAVDLNAVVGAFDKMMGHAVGDGVSVRLEPASEPLPVRLDPGRLELAILDLVRNAADDTDGGGTVVVRTVGRVVGDPGADGLGDRPPVELSVSDTGAGMPPELVARATDPFFATKAPGRGLGLGLWMVRRSVAADGGRMAIETRAGRGTTVRLVFPCDEAARNPAPEHPDPGSRIG